MNGEATYTLNTALSSTPKAFNPHTWETSDENYIPSFTTMGLYSTDLNETRDGYKIYNEMALSTPKDASSLVSEIDAKNYGYSGQIGPGYVYDIELNPLACFEDNTPITSKDYIESLKRLLSPEMANFRADFFWASNLVLANAESYFKQGKVTVEDLYPYLRDSLDGTPTDGDIYNDNVLFLNLGASGHYFSTIFPSGEKGSFYSCLASRPRLASDAVELSAKRIVDAAQYYIFHYVIPTSEKSVYASISAPSDLNDDEKLNCDIDIYDFDHNRVLVRKGDSALVEEDPNTYEVYSSDLLKEDLLTFVSSMGLGHAFQSSWSYMLPLFANMNNSEQVDFSSVGIKALDDYTLRFFFKQKISVTDLQFSFTTNWLVKVDLYDSLTESLPGSSLKTTRYGTQDQSNYVSYGPYKLSSFVKDNSIVMVKNQAWYGYHDSRHLNQYQTDRIVARIVKKHQTAKALFMQGELDSLSLEKSDVAEYGKSSRVKFVPESYTQKISFNSDRSKLKSRQEQTLENDNKTLLSNLKFRKALSLSIDRRQFASSATAGSSAFTGLLNQQYMIDSQNGITYRSTEQGKKVYEMVYGKLGGEAGGEMLNPEEVASGHTDNRSGYNRNYAIKLVKEALEEESLKEDGYRSGQTLTLEFLVSKTPEESETVRDAISFLSASFNAITEPNGFSTKIVYKKDEDYYNTAASGAFDMIYSIWGGVANNPYGLMQVYCDANFAKNCEYGLTQSIEVTVEAQKKVSAISVSLSSSSVTVGSTLTASATVTPTDADNKEVTWSIENGTGEATITSKGVITAKKEGSVTVVATAKDGSGVRGEAILTITAASSDSIDGSYTCSSDSDDCRIDFDISNNGEKCAITVDDDAIVETAELTLSSSSGSVYTYEGSINDTMYGGDMEIRIEFDADNMTLTLFADDNSDFIGCNYSTFTMVAVTKA